MEKQDGLYCGYAPRVLRRLANRTSDEEVLFVGCKDGSLTVLRRDVSSRSYEVLRHLGRDPGHSLAKTVRALLDYRSDHLVVGRDDGGLELINWRAPDNAPGKPAFLPGSAGESVRYAAWLDRSQTRLLVAFRHAGTRILFFQEPLSSQEDLGKSLEDSVRLEAIGGIRVAAGIPDPRTPTTPPGSFVLVDKEGVLWLWDSRPAGRVATPRPLGKWSASELPPATFEDATYVGPAPRGVYKDICALVVTTDTGVFALDLRERGWEEAISSLRGGGALPERWPRPVRLALPGGSRFCTAVTYSEVDSPEGARGQLWLTNREGESFLFENEPLGVDGDFQSWVLGFRSSGRFQLESQALTAVSWAAQGQVLLAQACRDDRVRIFSYSVVRPELAGEPLPEADLFRLRCSPDSGQRLRPCLLQALSRHRSTHELKGWPSYALLAELLDLRAADPGSTDDFFEYLSQPSTEVPVAILVSIPSEEKDASMHLAAAVRLWTLCLLGIVNRHRRPREEWYLGILRFLLGIREAVQREAAHHLAEEHGRTLGSAIERAIRFTRKWGLYGRANEIRQNLVSPLKILQAQHGEDGALLDQMTYYSLLFRRSYSEVAEDVTKQQEGDHAWAVKTLEIDCGTLVAGSWRRQGIALFVLESKDLLSPRLVRVVMPEELRRSSQTEAQVDRDRYNFSRDILLLPAPEGGNRFNLLQSTRATTTSELTEDLCLLSLELVRDGEGWKVRCLGKRRLPAGTDGEHGSIYRFLDLERDASGSHLVAVGLGGKEGVGEIALVDISGGGDLKLCGAFSLSDFGSEEVAGRVLSPDLKSFRNRVWSLARLGPGGILPAGSSTAFLAGCDNGEIWYVELRGGELSQIRLVARLASAVKALHTALVGGGIRVFAGTKDGTAVAFQQLERTDVRYPYLARLWATVESEEICHLDRHPYALGEEDFDLVLAVTRNGVCVAFDDCERAAPFKPEKKSPQRPPFPGMRWLRTATGRTCFAATSFENSHGIGQSAWRLVATASGDGCLRVISLHLPRYSLLRKEQFLRQCRRLSKVADEELTGADPSPAGDRAFRAVEAAYRSAPLLPLIIVRMILDPGIEEEGWLPGIQEARRWCLPQNMRPILELRQRWDEVLLKDASESEIDEVGKALAAGLDAAWAGRDVDLFQEICALTLKRLNGQLFRPEGLNAESLWKVYRSLFDVMRGRLQLWLGSPDRGELRSRIVVGKNLLDGDTFYDLSQRAARDPEGPWKNVLLKRVEGAVELILVGNDLVSLEALRAANHSLVRLCRRISEARRSAPESRNSLRWEFFQNYFSQLVHGAVQRLDANLRLGDAMAHEYSRAFALSFYACPEALLNISSDLVDSRLIRDPHSEDDFTASIEGQVKILSNLFDLHGFTPLWDFVKRVHLHFSVDKLPESEDAGEWEEEMSDVLAGCPEAKEQEWLLDRLREYGDLYRFVAKWKRFADSLSTNARDLGLATTRGIQDLKNAIPPQGEKRGVFPHSWAFWDSAVTRFSRLRGCPEQATDRIRPETILFVEQISGWARESIDDLEQRYSHGLLFEPEHGVFREVLSRVERAAREFPASAAVQKNLVVGILGHHLLEDLDLHVLELREIARNLHPAQTLENQKDDLETVAGRFASLLVRRSQRAQSLPKNLRALSKVLEPSPETTRSSDGVKSLFHEGMWNLSAWTTGDFRIANAREREFLALILGELEQNHSIHSGFNDDHRFYPLLEWRGECLTARFPVSSDVADRWQLVKEVVSNHGQKPFKPNPSPGVSSTGVGLYLSCLAASMVGWRMDLDEQENIGGADLAGWLIVKLFPPAATERLTGEIMASDAGAAQRTAAPGSPVRNVVVIDDKPEVALYVWRELGEVPGFGIAEAGEALSAGPLMTPAGDIRVWWVPATEEWRARLEELLEGDRLQGGAFFLVDVRGPVAGGGGSGTEPGYKVQEVLSTIQDRRGEASPEDVWLISSYEHGTRAAVGTGKPIEIRSKSPDTLSRLRKFLDRREEESGGEEPSEAAHVLVTGAGFEFRGAPSNQQLGMPPTGELLRRWMESAYRNEGVVAGVGFPVPARFETVKDLRDAAEKGDLDRYWSSILREERAAASGDVGDVLKVVAREYELRRLFRAEFVRHDWGHLPQALAAARMGWSAWVSTNYTRFANRAIEICGRDWLTVEFGEEAQDLSRQLLYGAAGLPGESILFKVHGDIGHVLTMALATEDKTIETRLSSFMPLYLAAERYLHELTRKRSSIVWHIVGHGLKDELLMHVIRTACEIDPGRHQFVVTAPHSEWREHPALELQRKLDSVKSPMIRGRYATADVYLTRLAKVGLGSYEKLLGELEEVPLAKVR